MAKRQKLWAKNERLNLLVKLGNKCIICRYGRKKYLEFDCIIPQGDKHHKMSTDQRICFYRKQHKLNNVQILCKKCHIKKTLLEIDEIMKKLTDEQITRLFTCLKTMTENADKAKLMNNQQLKKYIINSDIYGKLKINTMDIAVIEEVLERLYPEPI